MLAVSLDATWKRFATKRRAAGITRIADLTGLDTLGIPVFAAIRPMGKSLSTSQGKGITPQHARVSALMESLETFTAEECAVPIVRGSYRALAKRRAVVDVKNIPRPRGKLDLDARWVWVTGRDLRDDSEVLVPRESVTLDTTFTKSPVFDISSNGLASGNDLDEAILRGLCEVIERDAEAAWRREGGDRRLVLDTIDDEVVRGLIDRIVATGARIFVWDLSPADSVIPVIGCAIVEDPDEPAWRPLGVYQGFGAHADPANAIARAIVEAAQTRLTYIAGARDDFFPIDYERATDPSLVRAVWERFAAPSDEPATFDELPVGPADLRALVAQLDRCVIAVDLTHPKLRVPVAKVIVPGLACDVESMG